MWLENLKYTEWLFKIKLLLCNAQSRFLARNTTKYNNAMFCSVCQESKQLKGNRSCWLYLTVSVCTLVSVGNQQFN